MRIVDESLLKRMSVAGKCEWCGRWAGKREAHHLWKRGSGRLDLPFNLISLGSTPGFCCPCHGDAEGGRIARFDLLAVVAAREGLMQDAIEAAVRILRRLPKSPREDEVESQWDEHELGQTKELVRRVVAEQAQRRAA